MMIIVMSTFIHTCMHPCTYTYTYACSHTHTHTNSVVQKLRSATRSSVFVLGEDEALRRQVLILLKKQERRAAAKREKNASECGEGVKVGGEGDGKGGHKKVAAPSLSNVSAGEDRRKKKEK